MRMNTHALDDISALKTFADKHELCIICAREPRDPRGEWKAWVQRLETVTGAHGTTPDEAMSALWRMMKGKSLLITQYAAVPVRAL